MSFEYLPKKVKLKHLKVMTNMKTMRTVILVAVLCGLSGCATTNKDPLEGFNRGVYKFNDVADRYAMKPVAQAYKAVAPAPVRTGLSNFFSNLGTLTTIVNDLLQLKFAQAFSDAGRFVINTTFGIAGFIDVASMDKVEKHSEDFGQTLGYWGVGPGAYLVLPILGPSSVRDAGGLVFDTVTSDPITYVHNIGEVRTYNQLRAVQLLDKRTQLLDATDLVDSASIDPYAFMRDAYLQRRASQVQDGLVPKELLQDEFEPYEEPAPQNNSEVDAETVVSESEAATEAPAVRVSGTDEVVVSLSAPAEEPSAQMPETETHANAESVMTEPQEALPPLTETAPAEPMQVSEQPVVDGSQAEAASVDEVPVEQPTQVSAVDNSLQ